MARLSQIGLPRQTTDRAGHWEGDLLAGNHGSYLATLVDRMTRFTVLIGVTGKRSAAVIAPFAAGS